MAIISIAFIIISTLVLTLNTLPYFQVRPLVICTVLVQYFIVQRTDADGQTDFPLFALAEAVYMSWFTFEFLVRLIS